uniref:Uncharacterized protein n=1 Tax=Romanomermis culicivorax TaxID=13658 RepID=A0A915J9V5_ROMCU
MRFNLPKIILYKYLSLLAQTKSASSSLKKKFGNVNLRDRTPVQTKITRQLASSDKKSATPNQAKQRPVVVSPARRLRRNLSQTFSNDDSNSTWSLTSASCASFAASCGSSSHQLSNFNGFGGSSSPKKQCAAVATSTAASEYAMPEMAVENYARYMNNIKRERLKPSDDLFYARNNHRNSVFAEDSCAPHSTHDTRSAVPSAATVAAAAPKSRSGRS